MRVVIAEKAEAARDIAGALLGMNPGDVEIPAEGGGWLVTAASGHLLELVEPSKLDPALAKWELGSLPISFEPWPKEPCGARARKRVGEIARALDEADEVYCCGDADDEGQLIVDEIIEHARDALGCGFGPDDPRCKRVYVNDNLPANILKAFEQAQPNAGCMGAGRAAHARQLADLCFGVNESRLATCKLGATVALGRVQTPTMGLVIGRDAAREGHVRREHYELYADAVAESGERLRFRYRDEGACEDGKHCFDRRALEEAARAARGARAAFEVAVTRREVAPPLPFEMTSLVADMSKRHSMTADDVMAATQALRDEHKAITYNRTDSPYLKEEHHAQAPAVTATAMANIGASWPVDPALRSRAFDDSRVRAHHGIIPQDTRFDAAALPERERLVYEAVAMRYLAQFLPPARVARAEASLALEGIPGEFRYRGDFCEDAGWAGFAPAAWRPHAWDEGEPPAPGPRACAVECRGVEAKLTSPPPAFTDGTLMAAMAGVARYVEDEGVRRVLLEKDAGSANEHGGIGTTATRRDIIEGLIEHGYLARNGDAKRTITSTGKARALWRMLPDEIKGVDLTARWWLMQEDVRAGAADEHSIMRSVCEEFHRHATGAYEGMTLEARVATCPKCGGAVVARGRVYTCESNRSRRLEDGTWEDVSGCGFKVLPWCGKVLTPKQLESALAGKAVALRGCSGRKGKFDCKATVDADGNVRPQFGARGEAAGRRGRTSR